MLLTPSVKDGHAMWIWIETDVAMQWQDAIHMFARTALHMSTTLLMLGARIGPAPRKIWRTAALLKAVAS
jgi:hypothetical protein